MKTPSILLTMYLIFLLPAVMGAESNAKPSLHVGTPPCQVFSGNVASNTTTDLTADVGAKSNAEPSHHVGTAPCQVFSRNIAANTTADLDVRGVCGVPDEATAVVFAVHVTAAGTGTLKLWEYDGSQPSANA